MTDTKRLLKYFVFIFLLSFLLINFKEVSLVSNYLSYRSLWYGIERLFFPERLAMAKEVKIVEEIGAKKIENKINNKIEIPKIGVSAPILTSNTDEKKVLEGLLKQGTLLFPDFAEPGSKGQSIILGHSAPSGWPDIYFDNIFSDLNYLEKGDRIFVYYNGKEYVFEVVRKIIFYPKDEDKALVQNEDENPSLTLITCWPPGHSLKRLAIRARLTD
jgi:LPXTG-site transpeptidase (sortase) family protein